MFKGNRNEIKAKKQILSSRQNEKKEKKKEENNNDKTILIRCFHEIKTYTLHNYYFEHFLFIDIIIIIITFISENIFVENRREGRRSQKVNETPITEKGDETRIQATYTASLVVLVLVLVGAECKWCL